MITGRLNNPDVRQALARASANPGSYLVHIVQVDDRPRTPEQNKLFHSLVRKLAQQNGGSVRDWQDGLVIRFLGTEARLTPDGEPVEVPVSTSTLSVTEFSSFLTACLLFAQEHGVTFS